MPFGLLFLVSVAAGWLGSLTGMGGGILLIPVLTFFGIDIKQAIAISNISIIAVSISAAVDYLRRHMPNLNASAFLEVFAVLGAGIGALITVALRREPLFFLCGGILLFSWIALWRQGVGGWKPVVQQDRFSRWLGLEGSYYDYAEGRTIVYQGTHASLAGLLMFGAGMISGLLGMGASALTVLINEGVMGLPTKVSLTTSNLIIGVMALVGTNVYLETGLINSVLVAPVILGVPLGAFLGSKLLTHMRNQVARVILLGVLIVFGIEMIVQGFRGM